MFINQKQPEAVGRRRLGWVLATVLFTAATYCGPANEPASVESKVKAGFLLNFAKFVEWPADTLGQPLCIGILGKDPFAPLLEQIIKGKVIDGKPLQVMRLKSINEASSCRIIFVSTSERKRLNQYLNQLAGRPILTVSDAEEFTQEGGMIRLFLEGNNMRFEVNLNAVTQGGLKMSSKLLHLGRVIRSEPSLPTK